MGYATQRLQRLNRLERKLGYGPRQWCILLEDEEELPEVILAQIGEHDRVYIKTYPQGFLGGQRQGDWTYGYLIEGKGARSIKQDGSLERRTKR